MLSEREIGEPLVAGVRDGWIDEPDQREAIDALGRIGAYEGLAELVEARAVPAAARLAAAVKLTLGHSPQLFSVAGVGPTEVRKEVITGLSRFPGGELLAAAAAAGEASAAGDLWRAAVRGALAKDAAARRQLAAQLPRLRAAADYERRYRLATGHAELAAADGDAAALQKLLGELAQLAASGGAANDLSAGAASGNAASGGAAANAGNGGAANDLSAGAASGNAASGGAAANAGNGGAASGNAAVVVADDAAAAEHAALRQAVATVVARAARPELLAALEGLLGDGDAGVRLAAMRGLADPAEGDGATTGAAASSGGGAGGPAASGVPGAPGSSGGAPAASGAAFEAALDAALGARLSADRWPELRRAAAASLAHRCQRAAPSAALGRAVDADRDVEVRQDALVALVTCRAAGVAERLIRLWNDGEAPLPLRSRAVTLTVALGEARLAGDLLRSFARWRSEAFSEEAALRLAVVAAGALGQLGGPQAAAALQAALEDTAYPELVAAAATGLGAMGPRCPAAALPALQALTRSDERSISLAARRAVGRCGGASPRRRSGDAP
jgi:hypothetical protein